MAKHDILILGAGAAGLACAHELHRNGKSFFLIEGRDRVGGRVFSHTDPQAAAPIEFGAEFIHGAPSSTLSLFEDFCLPFYDVSDGHLLLKNKKLVEDGSFWYGLGQITDKMKSDRREDQSVHDFLKKHPRANPEMKSFFQAYVEGYHAADLELIGEKGFLNGNETDKTHLNGIQNFRPVHRYDLLLKKVFEGFASPKNHRLQTTVKKIEWKKGEITVTCEEGPQRRIQKFTCKKLVVALPLGVLKSSAITWDPVPKMLKKTLSHLEMGHIQRVTFRFKDRFWEGLTKQPITFMHSPVAKTFPTWWTLHPLRVPHLVAWQGGPRAAQMISWSEKEKMEAALETLSSFTGKSIAFLNSNVEAVFHHDWSTDPFSQGAYSYIAKDGLPSAQRFRRPYEDLFYFAGEATVLGHSRGTVHGAFESGLRVAKSLLA